jgi:hypothetical protein
MPRDPVLEMPRDQVLEMPRDQVLEMPRDPVLEMPRDQVLEMALALGIAVSKLNPPNPNPNTKINTIPGMNGSQTTAAQRTI